LIEAEFLLFKALMIYPYNAALLWTNYKKRKKAIRKLKKYLHLLLCPLCYLSYFSSFLKYI